FQAEDGIRDRNVTGVQTCALPIYPVAAGLLQSDGKGDPHPVNPDVDVYLGYVDQHLKFQVQGTAAVWVGIHRKFGPIYIDQIGVDRKSTRLNSSHVSSSYAVFCLK